MTAVKRIVFHQTIRTVIEVITQLLEEETDEMKRIKFEKVLSKLYELIDIPLSDS